MNVRRPTSDVRRPASGVQHRAHHCRWILLVVAVVLTAPTSGWSQTERNSLLGKDGLIIGIGLGAGVATTKTSSVDFGETTETSVTEAAVAGDFKLGAGLGEKVLLYWFGKAAGYNGPDSFGIGTQTETVAAVNGIGASYLVAPKVWLGAGAGAASLTNDRQTYWGLGFAVGGEYEFARHWLVGVDLVYGSPSPDELQGVDRDVTTLVFKATLNWLYY